MTDETLIPVKSEFAAHLNEAQYHAMYARSISDPEGFWGDIAKEFVWRAPWKKVKNTSFTGDVSIKWFEGGKLNITESCVDRWADKTPNKTAILWESDTGDEVKHITYAQLKDEVCKLANALTELGVKKGDVVTVYLPMVPEAAYTLLACARIGAVHSVVFAGCSPDAIKSRIEDGNSKFVITATTGARGGKRIPLKGSVDKAIEGLAIDHVLVLKLGEESVPIHAPRDVLWSAAVPHQSTDHKAVAMDAEDPLFILYTSGSTGKPKGVMHTTAGYLVYAATTTKYVFDLQPDDIYWCTADIGWVTGHSYIVYGPLANGATTLMFEGTPTFPDASRFWNVVDKHKVTKFYTAPTAIRALERLGNEWVKKTSRASLKLLASVGEPINPAAWMWYYETVGDSRCPVIDTWWQTETGGHMLTPLPGATALKPGSCTLPFFGVVPELFDINGNKIEGAGDGQLVIADSWPGQARSVWGDHKRFRDTYFSQVAGKYFTGDGARCDEDGYYWITGRVDDVINVSGHRLGTAEIESALVAHAQVSEAAVVGYPHEVKGQGIYAYVTLTQGTPDSVELANELKQWVRTQIGGLAVPDFIHLTPGLPKTRSGKIMRRILRKIAENEVDALGDVTTLLDPAVVDSLIATRLNR